jgi:Zn-dependent M28 family amino/carboxypeptidase
MLALVVGAMACESKELTEGQVARAIDVASAVDRDRLMGHVEALTQARATDEGEDPPWGEELPLLRNQSRIYILDVFRAVGLEPVEEIETANDMESANIYVDIPGAVAPDELVIICAHYDSWHIGADDNASGISVLLEAAHILVEASPPARTIRLLAFDREEEGLIGSRRYVDAHRNDEVVVVINLDAVAYSDSEPGSQSSLPGIVLPDTGNFLAALGAAESRDFLVQLTALSRRLPQPISVVGLLAPGDSRYPAIGDLLRSDHAWFWSTDVPALFLSDTADFRNPHYHLATDLPETLDYDFLASAAALTIGAAAAFAGVP